MSAPPSRPTPAPAAAALPVPPMSAPAAAPTAVPATALLAPLSAAACSGLLPPTWEVAYCRQSPSSARNWSKLLPVPGSDIWLGPLGTVTQPASASSAANAPPTCQDRKSNFIVIAPRSSFCRRLGLDFLPAARAFLHVGIVGVGLGAQVPP